MRDRFLAYGSFCLVGAGRTAYHGTCFRQRSADTLDDRMVCDLGRGNPFVYLVLWKPEKPTGPKKPR